MALVALACVVALPVVPALGAPHDLELVSRADGVAGAKGNSGSLRPSVSGDGRYVAFYSNSSNLDPADTDTVSDVYVRDLVDGTTTLVSRASGPSGAKANGLSQQPSISDDGRYVAFRSDATSLDPADTDTDPDVYVRDLLTATTTLVSRASGPSGVKGDGSSLVPSISGDGRYVAFASSASNLHPDDTDSTTDVFVRDLVDETTTLVSRVPGPTGVKGNGVSTQPSISGDARYVAFYSNATNLDPADTDASADVYVRDLVDGTTTLVSRASGPSGAKGNGLAQLPSITDDGRYVAFRSTASNLDPDDTDASSDVFVRDLVDETTTLVSRATGAGGDKGNGDSIEPSIAGDGRYVVFSSDASNLHPDDTDTRQDVFVRDLVDETTTLASRASGPTGVKANNFAAQPAISGDGRFVAFVSVATNLHPDDTDTLLDVFRRELGVAAQPYVDEVLADAPVGYWRLGESAGTVALDSSGLGNDGVYFDGSLLGGALLGQVGALVGDSDTAALFDGVNDEMRVPGAVSLNVGSTFTAEAWIRRSGVAQSHPLMNKGAGGLQLVVMNAANANQVWLRKAGATTIARSSVGIPADGAYHHVVVTMDGAGSARIYVDGVDVTLPEPGQQAQVIQDTALPLRMAGAAGATPVQLDELALYGGALSAARVQEHHAAGIGP